VDTGRLAALLLDGLLVAALGYAVFTDMRSRRIGNTLTYAAALLGLAIHTATGGWSGAATSTLGWLVGCGLLLVPYLRGAMGGGDVKLLAAIGALQGPWFVLLTAIYAGLAGGVLAVGYLVRQRCRQSRTGDGAHRGNEGVRRRGWKAMTIPYGPAIAAGAVVVLIRTLVGGV
jgi:prepilin peptidase CpaA